MKEHFRKSQTDSILQNLVNKFRVDPQGFRSYLPEVAQELEQVLPARTKKSYTSELTELERKRSCESLCELLSRKRLSPVEAIQALEYCATLIQDESLPQVIDRKTLLSLLGQVVGTPISKMKKNNKIAVHDGEIAKEMAILRGVYLELTWNDRLVAISIFPNKFKERSRALKLVGIAEDSASDVSERHDAYLAKVY
ncbi:MAG: hypothetical protein AABZ77_09040 [Chloroflexota bacterium]